MSTDRPTEIKVGQWIFRWSGGRIADISHVSRPAQALDVVQVGPYDIQAGESRATMETFQAAAHEWVDTYGADYARNVLPFRDPQ